MSKVARICLWCGESLPKRRRKYCCDEHSNLYFIHYISPLWWSCAREAALLRAGNKCECCESVEKLEVHHKIHLERWEARHNSPKNEQGNLRVLCCLCHEDAHRKLPLVRGRASIELAREGVSQLVML